MTTSLRLTAILLLALGAVSGARAATLVSDATLVGTTVAPASRAFEIVQSGRYVLDVSDVELPALLVSLRAAVTRGDQKVVTLAAAGQVQFDATPGTYEVQIAAVPSAAGGLGSFAARVSSVASGAIVLDYSDAVTGPKSPGPPGQGIVQTTVTLPADGNYELTVIDLGFPEALASADVLLTRGGVQFARVSKTNPAQTFAATAGAYDLLLVAQAGATTSAGLAGVRIRNVGTGAPAFESSFAIGALGEPQPIAFAAAGAGSLAVADLAFPGALGSIASAVVQGSTLLASRNSAGSSAFVAQAGPAALYAWPVPAPPAAVGSMSADVTGSTGRVAYRIFSASPETTSPTTSIEQSVATIAAGGPHRLTLTDFQFPAALALLEAAVLQNGQELGRRAGSGTLDVTAATGPLSILVAATPATSGMGLYGLQLVPSTSGTPVFERTQAAGAILQSRAVNVTTAGSYDVRLTDLQFPLAFTELAAAVTRGTQRVGFIFGGGRFSFDATPGVYQLNFVTRVDAGAKFGTYGLDVSTTPPVPTVTLSANPTSVQAGDSATLTWSTTGAASCVASGQWSGSRAVSGSQSVGPINVESTYTLTCTGSGGSAARSVTVGLRKASSGGGGGAVDLIAALLMLCAVFVRPRRAVRARRC
jgi:hypothetical protein